MIDLDEAAAGGVDPALLKAALLTLFRSPDYKPPLLPAVALELLELTRKPKTSIADVVRLMSRDPVLAGQVLGTAQSALYSGGYSLRSLEDAVSRLGLERVSNIFLRVSMEAKVFRAPGYTDVMEQLRKHSVFTAEMARLVSQRTSGLNEYAFLCGLLHDVGTAACILALAGPLKHLAPHGFADLWPVVRDIHEACSEFVVSSWGMPAEVGLVLRMHHAPTQQGRVHPLAAAVRLADSFAEHSGIGFMSEAHVEHMHESSDDLRLTNAEFSSLKKAMAELAKKLAD